MSQFMKRNETMVKLKNSSMVIPRIFIVCITLYNVPSIFNLMLIRFLRAKIFVLKFLLIEVIHSIC